MIPDKRHQVLGRCIRDAPHTNAPDPSSIFLCSNDNQGLPVRLPSANALLFTAVERLIHFHASGESIPARSHHGAPQFMQPSPRGVVTPQALGQAAR
jgi:hypothetical protein